MAENTFSSTNQPLRDKAKKRSSIQQDIANLEAKLARKRQAVRAMENGQKIIIGGMMLALAEKDPAHKKALARLIAENIKREADKSRIIPLLSEWGYSELVLVVETPDPENLLLKSNTKTVPPPHQAAGERELRTL